ncbi:glycosyltransferase family 2 protein [Thermodesulfobacteriota bacterium]
MLVSVVVPVFNGERYLAETLESVLGQSFQEFEVIVVDDGSTDRSARVLSEYKNRIKIIYQKNGGVCRARNSGVVKAKGELIAFIDQDDIWYKHKLERQVDVFLSNPETAFAYSNIDIIDSSGRIIEERGLESWNLDWIRPFIKGHLHPFPSTVMIKRELLLSQGGFSTDFMGNAHEDVELWARLCQVTDFYYIDRALVQYRSDIMRYIYTNTETDTVKKKNISRIFVEEDREYKSKNTIILHDKLEALYGKDVTMRTHLDRIFVKEAERQSVIGTSLAWDGNFKDARKRFLAAWKLDRKRRYLSGYLRSCLPSKYSRRLFPD